MHESNLGLAFLYMRGKGAQLDLGAAATFFEAAAEGGLAEAQYVAQNSACLSTYVSVLNAYY